MIQILKTFCANKHDRTSLTNSSWIVSFPNKFFFSKKTKLNISNNSMSAQMPIISKFQFEVDFPFSEAFRHKRTLHSEFLIENFECNINEFKSNSNRKKRTFIQIPNTMFTFFGICSYQLFDYLCKILLACLCWAFFFQTWWWSAESILSI